LVFVVKTLCCARLDAVVLNHAAFQDTLLLEYENDAVLEAEAKRICDVNIAGMALAAMKALRYLDATGRIAFVSSGSSIATPPFHVLYGARWGESSPFS
jgi:NAD(P)-dependent dehydrogenase (short-subunit alcohol dehydrogenase family)